MDKIIYDVLKKIEDNKFKAYIVGGYVRDFLMKVKSIDIDIATDATPKDIVNIFSDKEVVLQEYGNVTLEIGEFQFEITTFRREISYKNNRKPVKLKYIKNLDEDMLRRDFTINSIYMDKNGKIIDLLNGKNDIRKRIIRSIGNPYDKINQDSLRILRAVRFATILNFKLDSKLKEAIITSKDNLKTLSYERKKEELTKIFASKNKKYGIFLLKELQLVNELELSNINNVLLTKDLIGIWATIVDVSVYPFTKNEKEVIKEVNELLNKDLYDHRVLYKYGIYSISIAADLKKRSKRKITKIYDNLPIKERIEIKITSEEICEILNKEPGSFLKDIYNDLEEKILNKKLKNDSEKIKKYITNKYG